MTSSVSPPATAAVPRGWSLVRAAAARESRDLHPGYFALVMATGIISSGMFLLGPAWLSQVLLAVAAVAFLILLIGLAARLALYRAQVASDVRAPERVFGFFTFVAGADVLGVRLEQSGHPTSTVLLACVAAGAWLVLTYALPARLFLWAGTKSVLSGVNGTWLLWVVATQSISIVATVLIPVWPAATDFLAPVAVTLWSIGVLLYLLLVSIIVLRWLTVPMTPESLGPPYWILMGATAITVRAGGGILHLPPHLPVRLATAPVVEGFSFMLWAFGTWWIPLLVILGFWRHAIRHWPLSYEPTLWSMVFPLGMYAVATSSFGSVTRLAFMTPIARVMIWVAFATWVVVALSMIVSIKHRIAEIGPNLLPPTASQRSSVQF